MKKYALAATALLAMTACQPAGQADYDELRADVDALELEVFGDPRATCPDAQVISDIAAYEDSIADLPPADQEAEAWHIANGARADVVTTDSGLQYTVVQEGLEDGLMPVGGQMVKVNYHGFFPNGEVFDSSYERNQPIEFAANRVIQGWVEGLNMMKTCEARTLYIPGDLAYGEQGRAGIPENATLVFFVQLLGISGE